jgi:hypothetical protein
MGQRFLPTMKKKMTKEKSSQDADPPKPEGWTEPGTGEFRWNVTRTSYGFRLTLV